MIDPSNPVERGNRIVGTAVIWCPVLVVRGFLASLGKNGGILSFLLVLKFFLRSCLSSSDGHAMQAFGLAALCLAVSAETEPAGVDVEAAAAAADADGDLAVSKFFQIL